MKEFTGIGKNLSGKDNKTEEFYFKLINIDLTVNIKSILVFFDFRSDPVL